MPGAAGADTLVVDIGAGIGALIVYSSDSLEGAQIEIESGGGVREHTIVRPRQLAGRVAHAGVFPRLAAGQYTLLGYRDRPPVRFTITGGTVTEVHW